jgi:hypothetical protein
MKERLESVLFGVVEAWFFSRGVSWEAQALRRQRAMVARRRDVFIRGRSLSCLKRRRRAMG